MDSLVVTIKTAKKLKAAGFPQDTVWGREDATDAAHMVRFIPRDRTYIATPTAQELADQLPEPLNLILHTGIWNATTEAKWPGQGPTMAEALAALWLKIQEAKS